MAQVESVSNPKGISVLQVLIDVMERGWLPDSWIRLGIRQLCRDRLRSYENSLENEQESLSEYLQMLRSSPVAVHTDKANEQHYELPAEFFNLVLGPHRKYSCCYWEEGTKDLGAAEAQALELTVRRAELRDGMKVLELGCGWGSLSLFMAKKFPNSQIVAISNSAPQREFIQGEARKRGLGNLEVRTLDVAVLTQIDDAPFDRILSVEMFEHLRNYELMLQRVRGWLKSEGKLFIHIFTHRRYAYLFETEGSDNWMGRYFFTGGQMPSHDLLSFFQKDLELERQWAWSGIHYEKTSNAWLERMDQRRAEILEMFRQVYGDRDAEKWVQRWRVFFMACAELFGFREGREWGVSHYLLRRRD